MSSSTTPAIATDGLTKRFGPVLALDGLTLEVMPGEVFGFLGPNGAGKSTTLRLLLALIAPTAGSARVMGIDVRDVRRAHRHLAYVPGDVNLWPKLTGAECLELLGALHGGVDVERREELVERFDLDPSRRSRTYSKGNRQKVALIAAFSTRSEVMLLDEPTTGLDPLMEREFHRCVSEARERGRTIFLSSHLLSEVERLCERVGMLREGRLVEVATLERLRALHSTTLEIDLDAADADRVAPRLSAMPGVGAVERTGTGFRLSLSGAPGPLLRAIDELPVTALRSQEASLEEIFLTYYAEPEREAQRGGDGAGSSADTRA
jgi:ABC-2 type transport system ATP-binding protein